AAAARKLLRSRDRLLGLESELVEIHLELPSFRQPLLAVEHEVAAIFLVNFLNVFAQPALEEVDLPLRAAQLVLEAEHELDACEVEADLGREPLDDPQPVDVVLGVEARAAGSAFRAHEPLVLVDA